MPLRPRISRIAAAVAAACWLLAAGWPAIAQTPPAPPPAPPAEQLQALARLLADPTMRAWLEHTAAAAPRGAAAAETPAPDAAASSLADVLDARLQAIRDHLSGLAAAVPRLPQDIADATAILQRDMPRVGPLGALAAVAIFIALGFAAEWLAWRALAAMRRRIATVPLDSVAGRLRVGLLRLALAACALLAFSLGSIGIFLAFTWPPTFRQFVVSYLAAAVLVRAAVLVLDLALSPRAAAFRLVPAGDAAAAFWQRWLTAWIAWFAAGYATLGMLMQLGFHVPSRQLLAYGLGLGLLAIAIAMAWRGRKFVAASGGRGSSPDQKPILLTLGFIVLWLLWVFRAMPSFWLLLVALALPAATRVASRIVSQLLTVPAEGAAALPSTWAVLTERTLRAGLIIAGLAVLGWGWGIDLSSIAAQDTTVARFVSGALHAVIIVLVTDLLWHLARTSIDRKLRQAQEAAAEAHDANSDAARRQARLRTLLPIARNLLMVLLVVMAVLMALAALGVQIGPLLAGASVVGVAIGFGAQTIVRDVIAGMFYLLDDAFRVGEYIQSGTYKGTVEGFSLRSVRLRHHRGPLYTVPFGTLGAVQNMSRDWVIDKFQVGVTYDADLDKARKLIKQIGKELSADPELGPHILEPLKMQGVEQLGDFAVQIRIKIMTKPGEQFAIRRKAYAMIKKAFDANGINFAFPTVQVAGGGETATAAAHAGLALVHPPAAQAP